MNTRLTLHVIGGRLNGSQYVLEAPSVCKIGRADECELRLPASWEYMDVSRRHCLIEVRPTGARVRDLGSRNGTYLNGEGIGRRTQREIFEVSTPETPPYELRHGDELRVGATVFRVGISGADADTDRTPLPKTLCGLEGGGYGRNASPSLN